MDEDHRQRVHAHGAAQQQRREDVPLQLHDQEDDAQRDQRGDEAVGHQRDQHGDRCRR